RFLHCGWPFSSPGEALAERGWYLQTGLSGSWFLIWGHAFRRLELALKPGELLFQFGQSLQCRAVCGPIHLQEPALTALRYERRTIEPQPADVKNTGLGQAHPRTVIGRAQVDREFVPLRVKQATGGVGSPMVCLELVAGVAAVHQVVRFIRTALGARLKVIHCQLGPGFRLAYTAVATPEAVALSEGLALLGGHEAEAGLPPRMRSNSWSIARRSAFTSASVCS